MVRPLPRAAVVLAIAFSTSGIGAQTPEGRTTRDLVLPEHRIALVIGNNAYAGSPLQNAVPDARAVSAALRGLGFAVTLIEDAKRADMASAIATAADTLRPDDVMFFFYAGHGVQIGGENYLIPVDFDSRSGTSVRLSALATTDLQEALSKAKVSLIALDACRNNPFAGHRGAVGLAPMEARGSLVAYATGAGQTASDNPGASNGLFTQELLKALREPDLSARSLFYRIRQRVYEASNGRQFPAVYDGLIGDAVLGHADVRVDSGPAPQPSRDTSVDAAEVALWNAIAKSTRAADYEAYLAQYPRGVFAPLATSRLTELRRETVSAAAAELPGTTWRVRLQFLSKRKVPEGEAEFSLRFDPNGVGLALWDQTMSVKWTRVGSDLLVDIRQARGCHLKVRARIEQNVQSGDFSNGGSGCFKYVRGTYAATLNP